MKVALWTLSIVVGLISIYFVIATITPNISVWIAKTIVFDVPPETSGLPDQVERKAKVDVTLDLKYPSLFKKNEYDLFLPKDGSKKHPLVLWLHGGGFVGGNKEMITLYGEALASDGYAVVAMNYELAPKAQYPTPLKQVEEMLFEISSNKVFDNVDLSQVILAGDSAGAHIVEQYALAQTNQEFSNSISIDKNNQIHIKGLLLYSGVHNLHDMINTKISTLDFFSRQMLWSYMGDKNWVESDQAGWVDNPSFVTHDFPPVYITDGNTSSFESAAKKFAIKLNEKNIEVKERYFDLESYTTLHEFQFDLSSEPGKIVYQDTLDFLGHVLNP